MKDKDLDRLVRDVTCAKLRSEGAREGVIAEKLGLNQSTVNRILARQVHGRFVFDPKPPRDISMAELTSRMDALLNKGRFRETLRSIANNNLLMIDVAIQKKQHRSLSNDGFGPRTAQLLSRLVDRTTTGYVGCTWGREIRPFDTEIPFFVTRKPPQKPIRFLSLCGIDMHNPSTLARSSTVIASRFDRLVNKKYERSMDKPKLFNLNGLPIMHKAFAQMSKDLEHKSGVNPVAEYIRDTNPDYTAIYGNQDLNGTTAGLIDEVDTIITSVGHAGDHLREHLKNWFPDKKSFTVKIEGSTCTFSIDEICNDISAGDIAGPILPKPGPNIEKNRLVCNALNENLATLRPQHLRACHERAKQLHEKHQEVLENNPKAIAPAAGVVAVVEGIRYKDALLSALSEGLVTRVIMDYELEQEIIQRIKKFNGKPTLEQLLD